MDLQSGVLIAEFKVVVSVVDYPVLCNELEVQVLLYFFVLPLPVL